METISEARKSVKKLKEEFKKAKTDTKKLRVARATQLAENRARAVLEREDLSDQEEKEFEKIANIYTRASDKFYKKYGG